ncbi:hypothetical protein K469DRAFT_476162, partial [Zopfia rhizophila CBS 207.26]
MQQKGVIAASVVLPFCFASVMLLIGGFLWAYRSAKDKPDTRSEYSLDPHEQRSELVSTNRSWVRMFIPKRDRGRWVPTLTGIVKAGDEGLYSSALFDVTYGHPGEMSLETIYDMFAHELSLRPMTERSTYPASISKFLSDSRHQIRRGNSIKDRNTRPALPPRPSQNPLDLAEKGPSRSRSRKTSPVLISTFNGLPSSSSYDNHSHTDTSWTHEVQHAQYHDGRTTITVTHDELAVLSLFLGATLTLTQSTIGQNLSQQAPSDKRPSFHGVGAFGISIHGSVSEEGQYHIHLTRQKRNIAERPSRGSGYSTLFAKHLALGSMPFSQDDDSINSILITPETLDAVKSGARLHLQKLETTTKASSYLATLPASKETRFHTLAHSSNSTSTPLLRAIAALLFTGGLPPLASTPLIQTIRFIASAGLPAGRLLQRLEGLVDKVHRQDKHLQLFGPLLEDSNAGLLFRERERLGKLATGAVKEERVAEKVARMGRYVTLLERLMALVPGMRPGEVLGKVREATKREIENSYREAVLAHQEDDYDLITRTIPPRKHKRNGSSISRRTAGSTRSSISPTSTSPNSPVSPTSTTSPRLSSTFGVPNLGTQVESILKADLPLDIPTIATVARLILVAWTYSVEAVAWEGGEEGVRLGNLKVLPEKMM